MNPRRKCRRCLSALPLVATQPGPAPSLIAVPLVRSSKLQVVSCHKTTSPSTIPSHQPSTAVLLPRVPFCFAASLLSCFVASTHTIGRWTVCHLPPFASPRTVQQLFDRPKQCSNSATECVCLRQPATSVVRSACVSACVRFAYCTYYVHQNVQNGYIIHDCEV